MKIGVYFASTSGSTDVVVDRMVELLGDLAVKHDIAEFEFDGIEDYDFVIFGAPTWDYGHLQSDWEDAWETFQALDLSHATVAIFGLGDQLGYPEWYLDAVGIVYEHLSSQGVRLVGHWPNEGYTFENSKALTSDKSHFVGLALDDENQDSMTEERVSTWIYSVLESFSNANNLAEVAYE